VGDSDGSVPADRSDAHRCAELLIEARRRQGLSCREISKRSNGRFSVAELHALERGDADLNEDLLIALSALYDADLDAIQPDRHNLFIGSGVLTVGETGGSYTAGDPTSLLATYLRLIRGLRRQQRAPYVELRRDDIEHLAQYVERSVDWVVAELSALMGATRAQHRPPLGLFTGGATVIAVMVAAFVSC
jgi:hypothetical protein